MKKILLSIIIPVIVLAGCSNENNMVTHRTVYGKVIEKIVVPEGDSTKYVLKIDVWTDGQTPQRTSCEVPKEIYEQTVVGSSHQINTKTY